MRLASDVPVGLFLSGGIDSGLVCRYATDRRGDRPLVAVTATFAEAGYSELPAAAAVAKSCNVEHRVVQVVESSLDELPAIAWHCGEPFSDSSVVNQYQLARVARRIATVFLTGDGGDEAFGGYDEYVRAARWGPWFARASELGGWTAALAARVLPGDSVLAHRLWKLSGGSDVGALVRQNFRDPLWRRLICRDWQRPQDEVEVQALDEWRSTESLPLVARMQRFDYTMYLESDVLVKVDRATMAHSVEARSPFLDHRVVALAAGLPVAQHVDGRSGKKLLRQLGLRHLPSGIAGMAKHGFGLPVQEWMRSGLAARLADLLASRPQRAWWDRRGVAWLLRAHERGSSRDLTETLWRVLMLEAWASAFLDGERPRVRAS